MTTFQDDVIKTTMTIINLYLQPNFIKSLITSYCFLKSIQDN